ncbi:N-acetylglucosamine kinase [Krasilnikovia sp. MM14-A1004]|uniref:N-acetylglucosamine kinase n=1 Tax=Krasilnikovia sp. MM14-A1004 TaxID=3373541 RepID=UPI00399CE57D
MTALFLAVDGGNSKTDVVLGTADGRVLGYARGGTSSPHSLGLPGAVRVLDTLIADARARAGVPAGTPVDLAAIYLAGADLPVEVDRLHAAVADRDWARRYVVDNDCFALLRAGTANPDAIAVVCGAGNNCVGRAADGRTARFPSLGPISGDWGGGHDLAEHTLRDAARGEDGRGEPTGLTDAVARHFGRPTVESVSIALHLGELPRHAVHELTPLLFDVAAAGDPVALRLVRRQADEILAQHRVAAARLGLTDAPHALVLGGGVLRARHAVLHEWILAGAHARSPRVEVTVVADPPVAGAALLALDTLHGGPAPHPVERSVRTALGDPAGARSGEPGSPWRADHLRTPEPQT